MTDLPALAILQDGTRVPVSDRLKDALRLFEDHQYDDAVVGIARSGEATDTQTVAGSNHMPRSTHECRGTLVQKALLMIASFTVTESVAATAPRDMYRKVGNKLVLTPVDKEQDGYATPDPKRYKLILCGMSDQFKEDGEFGLQDKVVCEFMVVGSRKWEGTRFSSYYTIPKSWTNDRARLGLLAAALMGKALLEKDDKVDFNAHILNEDVFEGVVEIVTSAKGFPYPKITNHLALDTDDDDTPVTPRQRQLAADDEFPEA